MTENHRCPPVIEKAPLKLFKVCKLIDSFQIKWQLSFLLKQIRKGLKASEHQERELILTRRVGMDAILFSSLK